ncbi:hypothetical protein KP509_10G032700 [Ceratopteris richardii]|nr:hypothetical protein KP509_10G032700 [Ceratopteris richardii]
MDRTSNYQNRSTRTPEILALSNVTLCTSASRDRSKPLSFSSDNVVADHTSCYPTQGICDTEDNVRSAKDDSSANTQTPLSQAVTEIPTKRKRDWMSSLYGDAGGFLPASRSLEKDHPNTRLPPVQQHGLDDKRSYMMLRSNDGRTRLTNVRVLSGFHSFPTGWEQYLDLVTGETYYVNWKTRTKHCQLRCPEVQRCLEEGRNQQEQTQGLRSAQSNDPCMDYDSRGTTTTVDNNDSAERWLSRMTIRASAIAERMSPAQNPDLQQVLVSLHNKQRLP